MTTKNIKINEISTNTNQPPTGTTEERLTDTQHAAARKQIMSHKSQKTHKSRDKNEVRHQESSARRDPSLLRGDTSRQRLRSHQQNKTKECTTRRRITHQDDERELAAGTPERPEAPTDSTSSPERNCDCARGRTSRQGANGEAAATHQGPTALSS